FALGVLEPYATGIGGDCFCLFYDAQTTKVTGINGTGRSSAHLSLDMVRAAAGPDGKYLPYTHGLAVNVPGAVAGLADTLAAYGSGRHTLAEVLAPSIRLAREGFPVPPVTAQIWQRQLVAHSGFKDVAARATFEVAGGGAPRPGQLYSNADLANTLESIAAGGVVDGFYRGPLADSIVAAVRDRGGVLDQADLANHTSLSIPRTVSTVYRGVEIHECPPNSLGITALIALRILEELERTGRLRQPLAETSYGSIDHLHPVIEAVRIALNDTRWYVAHPEDQGDTATTQAERFLHHEYIAERAKLFNSDRANPDLNLPPCLPDGNEPVASVVPPPSPCTLTSDLPAGGTDTVYVAVMDGHGNACSLIMSVGRYFGSGIVPAGSGFVLHGRGESFALDPRSPNVAGPAKRPLHTLCPAMVTTVPNLATGHGRQALHCLGMVGALLQSQGHVQLLVNLLAFGYDPQCALNQPRFIADVDLEQLFRVTNVPTLVLEEEVPQTTREQLVCMGYTVKVLQGLERYSMGRAQIVSRVQDRATGKYILVGAAEPRADGQAEGW
ncbi:hypothetical protein IWQ60_006324, partial [Tieghemiomyces parasiticus]